MEGELETAEALAQYLEIKRLFEGLPEDRRAAVLARMEQIVAEQEAYGRDLAKVFAAC